MMQILVVLISGILLAPAAYAESKIDPIERSYRLKQVDSFGDLQVRRTYSSRSVYRGLFGIGWCSELDGRVQKQGTKHLYHGCDRVTAGQVDPLTDPRVIRATAVGFERTEPSGVRQVFSLDGRLRKVLRSDGSELAIERGHSGQIVGLRFRSARADGRSQRAAVREDGELIVAILETTYSYRNSLLLRVDVAGDERERYSYDPATLNLTAHIDREKRELIWYDRDLDRVRAVSRVEPGEVRRLRLKDWAQSRARSEGRVEIEIEVERGAEKHPARILIDPLSPASRPAVDDGIQLEGDREALVRGAMWIGV